MKKLILKIKMYKLFKSFQDLENQCGIVMDGRIDTFFKFFNLVNANLSIEVLQSSIMTVRERDKNTDHIVSLITKYNLDGVITVKSRIFGIPHVSIPPLITT